MKTLAPITRKLRCAVYTRKSTEEGLEQEFNSLDAQREACEAYVVSQKAEGWLLVPDRYDDGGVSGATLERPALKRLLADIEVNRVDIVVVYKIDRLSRSLMDFAKLVEVFDRNEVTFVSVTQSFNTTTSMGRLTLNSHDAKRRRESDATLTVAIPLMIATGMRVGELCKLRVEDISADGSSIRVQGKGSRDRVVYISDRMLRRDLLSLVRRRLNGRPHAGRSLFLNRLGSSLRPQSVRSKLRRHANLMGLSRRVTPHMLRHTAATLLIETGVDIRFVQRLLGHSSIATTELYTHVSDEALKSTLERADVLGTLGETGV